jgi:murein DD-endopeptidase MepM/ murein hydrolase activator NlpD
MKDRRSSGGNPFYLAGKRMVDLWFREWILLYGDIAMHNGIDIASHRDTSIMAAAAA